MLGSDHIVVFSRDPAVTRYAPIQAMLLYVYDLPPGPLQFGGKTRINLADELVSLGYAFREPGVAPPQKPLCYTKSWKSAELPKVNEVFFGKVSWIGMDCDVFVQPSKRLSMLESMLNWLNEKYRDTQPTQRDLDCKPGDLCIAK